MEKMGQKQGFFVFWKMWLLILIFFVVKVHLICYVPPQIWYL